MSAAVIEAAPRSSAGLLADLISLTKPRLSSLVLITTAGGWLLAGSGAPVWKLLEVVFATALVVGSANALNCWLERDVDARMRRTSSRPLPSGRLSSGAALTFGLITFLISIPLMVAVANLVSASLAALAFFSYVGVYTPLKRTTSLATVVGALPGALPSLIGWTAARGRVELPGLVLFAVLFLWQIPHFLALSIMLSEDYRRAGLKILPLEAGELATRVAIVLWALALIPVSLLLVPLGLAGGVYGATAASVGSVFLLVSALGLLPGSGRRWAGVLFVSSIGYLTVLFAVLALDARG